MPPRIRDQIIVITGASSGIGRETAILFGKQQASLILAARVAPVVSVSFVSRHLKCPM